MMAKRRKKQAVQTSGKRKTAVARATVKAVSYTHLTLPTNDKV
mgnify:CR=1 FL=1